MATNYSTKMEVMCATLLRAALPDQPAILSAIVEAAEREGMKRGADFANKQFEYCRERKSSADTTTQDNFWGGCADTAAIIRDRVLSEAKESE